MTPSHIEHSSSMELLIESTFLADLLQHAWFERGQVVDVLHSTVDAFGYDVVLECGPVIRHVQLKAKKRGARTSRWNISTRLADRPSGCVVLVEWHKEEGEPRLELQYRWFGADPGSALPDLGTRTGRTARRDAAGHRLDRAETRVVTQGQMPRLPGGIAELTERLFGPVGGAGGRGEADGDDYG